MPTYGPTPGEQAIVFPGAVRAWVSGPSIVSPGQPFDLRVSFLRFDGHPQTDYEGTLRVEHGEAIRGLPDRIHLRQEDEGSVLIRACLVDEKGSCSFRLLPEDGFFPAGTCRPIWVKKDFPFKLFWGHLHVNSRLGGCHTACILKSPDYGCWFAQDIMGHHFCSITDHASGLSADGWTEVKAAAERWHDPGHFVSVVGFQGDYDGGHFNFYFPGNDGLYQDFGNTPGGPAPMLIPGVGAKRQHYYTSGCVTAVFAQQLTREALLGSLRRRPCYASSMEKMLLWVQCNGSPMRSEIEGDKVVLEILVATATGPLHEVMIVQDGQLAATFDLEGDRGGFREGNRVFKLTWGDDRLSPESSYYVRVTQYDGHVACSGPVWVKST